MEILSSRFQSKFTYEGICILRFCSRVYHSFGIRYDPVIWMDDSALELEVNSSVVGSSTFRSLLRADKENSKAPRWYPQIKTPANIQSPFTRSPRMKRQLFYRLEHLAYWPVRNLAMLHQALQCLTKSCGTANGVQNRRNHRWTGGRQTIKLK